MTRAQSVINQSVIWPSVQNDINLIFTWQNINLIFTWQNTRDVIYIQQKQKWSQCRSLRHSTWDIS